MVTILSKSDKPCFSCKSKEDTVVVKIKEEGFSGVLCMEHVYEHVPEGRSKSDAESDPSG